MSRRAHVAAIILPLCPDSDLAYGYFSYTDSYENIDDVTNAGYSLFMLFAIQPPSFYWNIYIKPYIIIIIMMVR